MAEENWPSNFNKMIALGLQKTEYAVIGLKAVDNPRL
jgi:hypothetical protein